MESLTHIVNEIPAKFRNTFSTLVRGNELILVSKMETLARRI